MEQGSGVQCENIIDAQSSLYQYSYKQDLCVLHFKQLLRTWYTVVDKMAILTTASLTKLQRIDYRYSVFVSVFVPPRACVFLSYSIYNGGNRGA